MQLQAATSDLRFIPKKHYPKPRYIAGAAIYRC